MLIGLFAATQKRICSKCVDKPDQFFATEQERKYHYLEEHVPKSLQDMLTEVLNQSPKLKKDEKLFICNVCGDVKTGVFNARKHLKQFHRFTELPNE